MKKYCLLSFFLLFLFACKDRKTLSITELFENSKSLKHQLLEIENASSGLLSPVALEIHDNLMIVLDVQSSELFSAIDLKEKRIIKTFGKKGQGPGEFMGVMDFYSNYADNGINAWDPMLKRLHFYNYDSIMSIPDPLPENLFESIDNQPFLSMFYPNVLQINEVLFLGVGNSKDKRFSLLNTTTNEMVKTGDFPEQDNQTEIIPMLRNKAYNGMVRLNKQLMKIAYVSFYSEMFEIWDVETSGLKLEFGNYTTIPMYKQLEDFSVNIEEIKNGKGKNIALSVSDNKIVILYQTYPKNDIKNEQNAISSRDADIVLVFDWSGKPLQKYYLDCKVSNIEYDEKSNILYAIRSNPDPELIYFKL